jgi:hypothetical protein
MEDIDKLLQDFEDAVYYWGKGNADRDNDADAMRWREIVKQAKYALRARIEELESQINDLCPVGDLVGLPAWQAEKRHMIECIAELEETQRWIPVSEPPEHGWRVIVYLVNKYQIMATFYGNCWRSDLGEVIDVNKVTHWRDKPLPPPAENEE